jgi:hypothetical protein
MSEISYYRYVHGNGAGLMNNQALDYMCLTDEEESDVIDGYLGLQQPCDVPRGAIFAFTEEGRKRHRRLLRLLAKASRYGVRITKLDPTKFEVVWYSDDGQVALRRRGVKSGQSRSFPPRSDHASTS